MGFTESVGRCLRGYRDFGGRASRSEYWWFRLFLAAVQFAAPWVVPPAVVAGVVLLLPDLAVTVRRLHDVDRSGWWMLLPPALGTAGIGVAGVLGAVEPALLWGAILVLGWLGFVGGCTALFVFMVLPGSLGPNRHGPDPRPPAAADDGL